MSLIIVGIILLVIAVGVCVYCFIRVDEEIFEIFTVISVFVGIMSCVMIACGLDNYAQEQRLQGIKEYVNNPSKYKIIKDIVIEEQKRNN